VILLGDFFTPLAGLADDYARGSGERNTPCEGFVEMHKSRAEQDWDSPPPIKLRG
jgi:hypothetical protein